MKRVSQQKTTVLDPTSATRKPAFICPHCRAYAHQQWTMGCSGVQAQNHIIATPVVGWSFATCQCCGQKSVWYGDRMVYPETKGGPPPNPHLPADIRKDYQEAQAIVGRSPRGAAALLRLSIQKLCKHLGEKGKDLNDDIASLVKKGLPSTVQQALDAVRVIGNEAVHPGQMDLRDDRPTAETLFQLVNLVAQRMISDPKQVQAVYDGLPQAARDKIGKRDQPSPTR
jgi:hypothetical protein